MKENLQLTFSKPLSEFYKTIWNKSIAYSLMVFLVSMQPLYTQSLFWSILETNFNSYEEARAFIKAEDNSERVFSLLYTPQYIVYGSTSETPINHPKIQDTWTLDDLETTTHIPIPLSQFFQRLYEEDERFSSNQESAHSDSHLQPHDIEKGLDEQTYNNQWNSERMAGLMTCTVLFIESDGSDDPDYYTWTAQALLDEKIAILRSLHTWSYTGFRYGIDVTFIPQWLERGTALGQGREPNLHFGNFETYSSQVLQMNKEVLAKLGYSQGFNVGDEFNFDQRRLTAADGAFTVGVHYDHAGRGRIRAHAYLGGPYTFLSSRSPFSLYGHEIGHIFHAFDEYLNSTCVGNVNTKYNGISNLNNIGNGCEGKQSCLMVNNAVAGNGAETYYALCEYTVAHIGWAGDIATKPLITYPSQDTSFAFYLQEFKFHFPPGGQERKSAVVKVWREGLERPKLIHQEVFSLESDDLSWYNNKITEPGEYKMIVQHGQPYRYALVDSEPLYFTITEEQSIAVADSCIWFCGDIQPIQLGLDNIKWYDSPSLQEPLFIGDNYKPASNGTYYVVYEEEGQPKDVTQLLVSENFPVTAQLLQTYSSSGPIHLYLQSFTGIPHTRAFRWYKEGELIATTEIPGLDVMEEGEYQVIIDNGCESATNTLNVQRAPEIQLTQNCEDGSYTLTANRLISLADFNGQAFYVTDSVHVPASEDFQELNIYSEDGTIFWNVYELEPLEVQTFVVENLEGYLRFKSEEYYETVNWFRNDTLVLDGKQEWFIVDQPGTYRAEIDHSGRLCPIISQNIDFPTLVSPPSIDQKRYTICLSDIGALETLTVTGENVKWFLEPQKEELIAEGNSFQPSSDYYGFNSSLFITQEVDGQISPPLVVELIGLRPLEVSIDTFDQQFLAIVNGIQPNYTPDSYAYDWFFEASFLTNTLSPQLPLGDPGTYYVELSNQQPLCILSEPFTLEGVVSSSDNPKLERKQIQLYPNPVMDKLWLGIEEEAIRSVQIFNLNGQLVKQLRTNPESNIQIPVQDLVAGFYLAVLHTDAGPYPVKFVKE